MNKEVVFNIKLNVNNKQLVPQITANVEGLQKAIREVTEESTHFRNKLITINQKVEAFQNFSSTLSQVTTAINSITEESRTFLGAMAQANTMAGKSQEDFEQLTTQVAQLATTIPIARDQLAEGLYQVISNGVPEDNWITYLEASAKASIGGIANLGETVKVTSTIIKNYGLDWSAAQEIQDKIQLTAKNGVTSFEQMAQALPRVTSQASNLGVTVDELMSIFATLTGVSGNTAEVSTQLAAVFTALIKPSSEATEMASQMGIEFNAASIKAAGGLSQFVTQLDATVKQYSSASGMLKEEIYGKLFGSAESLRALTPLTNQLADKFAENTQAMKDSAGTINDAFSIMASTGSAKLQLLNNKLGEYTDMLQASIGNALPILNFSSQLIITAASAMQLALSLKGIGASMSIANIATKVGNGLKIASVAITNVLTGVLRMQATATATATVATRALAMAVKGLMIATGVGAIFWGISEALNVLTNKSNDAANTTNALANAQETQAETIKNTYQNTLKTTYGELIGKYEQLKTQWKLLKDEHSKNSWIKENKTEFDNLGITVDSLTDAENVFEKNTSAIVEGFRKRALAAASYAAMTTAAEKYIGKLEKNASSVNGGGYYKTAKKGDRVTFTNGLKEGEDYKYANNWVDADGRIHKGEATLTATGAKKENQKRNAQALKRLSENNDKAKQEYNKSIDDLGKIVEQNSTQTNTTKLKLPPKKANTSATKGTNTKNEKEKDPTKGSVDWYEKEISEIKKQINATSNIDFAKTLNDNLKTKESELKGLKIKIGLEDPTKEETKTAIEQLQEQINVAKTEFDSATTIQAKVVASTKINDLQSEIDDATNGKVSIKAVVTPTYITEGSDDDKRQSYSNAQIKANQIKQDYDIGLISSKEATEQMSQINAQLSNLKLKPIKLELDTTQPLSAIDNVKETWSGVKGFAGAIDQITNALQTNSNAWQVLMSVVDGALQMYDSINGIITIINSLTGATETQAAVTTGLTAAKAAEATTDTTTTAVAVANSEVRQAETQKETGKDVEAAAAKIFKRNSEVPLVGVAIAAGMVGMMLGTMLALPKFAEGGIAYGPTLGIFGEYAGAKNNPEVVAPLNKLKSLISPQMAAIGGEISLKVKGRNLVGVLANETRISRRNTNIKI